MDAKQNVRERRRQKLLSELAELQLEEFRETGTFDSTPHFSSIEEAAHQLGQLLSRQVQEQSAHEVAKQRPGRSPVSDVRKELSPQDGPATVKGIDGPLQLDEAFGECRHCRRSFFPSAD